MNQEEQLQSAFSSAKELPESVSFLEAKVNFLSSLGAQSGTQLKTKFSAGKLIIIVLITASMVAIAYYAITQSKHQTKEPKEIRIQKTKTIQLNALPSASPSIDTHLKMPNSVDKTHVKSTTDKTVAKLATHQISFLSNKSRKPILSQLISNTKQQTKRFYPNEYRFPALTEDEIKLNNKRKKKLIRQIGALKNQRQVLFSEGNLEIDSSSTKINSFYMERAEITNMEYRIFLFDLLIQNRKREFRLAEPQQQLWGDFFDDTMKQVMLGYFSEETYNDYPVVNVPRRGAELFCKWLTEEVKLSLKSEDKHRSGVFRLPQKDEWLYAATDKGRLETAYPWGSDSTIHTGCFHANYMLDKSELKLLDCQIDDNDEMATTTAGYSIGRSHVTAKVITYNPSQSGLFNLCGNVAEMVYEGTIPGSIGGGWMNSAEELKFDAEDPHAGFVDAHPNLGFRIVRAYVDAE